MSSAHRRISQYSFFEKSVSNKKLVSKSDKIIIYPLPCNRRYKIYRFKHDLKIFPRIFCLLYQITKLTFFYEYSKLIRSHGMRY